MANNGPVNSNKANNSFRDGIRRNGGNIFFWANAWIIQAQLINVAIDVAAAAPAQPHRNGQTHNAVSPNILMMAARAMMINGVIASRVAIKVDKHTLCANAAHAMIPLQ
jgi:hypothetical protein